MRNFRFLTPCERSGESRSPNAVANRIVGESLRFTFIQRRQPRVHQGEHILRRIVFLNHREGGNQIFRRIMPSRRSTARQENRHAVFGKCAFQKRRIARRIAHEYAHIPPAPAVFRHQPSRQCRRESAFLLRIAQKGELNGGGILIHPFGGKRKQAVFQMPKRRLSLRSPHRHLSAFPNEYFVGFLRFADFNALCLTAVARRRTEKLIHLVFQRLKCAVVRRFGIVFKRQKHARCLAFQRHRRNQTVHRGRHHIESVEPNIAFAEKFRFARARGGRKEFAFAVEVFSLNQRFVCFQNIGQVVELHARRAVHFLCAFTQGFGLNPRLTEVLQLFRRAFGETSAKLCAPINAEILFRQTHRRAHQHHASPIVDSGAVGLSRRIENARTKAIRSQYLNAEGAFQTQFAQKELLRCQCELTRNHNQLRFTVRLPHAFR